MEPDPPKTPQRGGGVKHDICEFCFGERSEVKFGDSQRGGFLKPRNRMMAGEEVWLEVKGAD